MRPAVETTPRRGTANEQVARLDLACRDADVCRLLSSAPPEVMPIASVPVTNSLPPVTPGQITEKNGHQVAQPWKMRSTRTAAEHAQRQHTLEHSPRETGTLVAGRPPIGEKAPTCIFFRR